MELTDVAKLAHLSRIEMTEAEQIELLHDMQSILAYVGEIESVATNGAVSLSSVRNVMREDGDAHASGFFTEALLKEAPSSEAGFVKVTQIFSDDEAPTL
jgi:aspartyl-tRNA(Asn)/glutamyl-tRNA(Gln) amidotransferase subunit C